MKFETKEPDIETIVGRIERKIYDLQPDFQRGEVWTTNKKQRLIDSILRRWHLPPIHLVARSGGKFDVLDGQQRLTAIRDFVAGDFSVGRAVEPFDEDVEALAGMKYHQLPDDVKNDFDTFPIRIFELRDYAPEEPHELFFRLNQPTSLTEAEKRNAFMGGPRNQVKELVDWATERGMQSDRIGFSNARMAYDDLIARFLLTLEQGTLLEKITAAKITSRYRKGDQISSQLIERAKISLTHVLELSLFDMRDAGVKPNKATIHTWLCFAAKLAKHELLEPLALDFGSTVERMEKGRFERSGQKSEIGGDGSVLHVFHDRSTSRVADVSSVILRDLTAWMFFARANAVDVQLDSLMPLAATRAGWSLASESPDPDRALYDLATRNNWGGANWL